jgi:hypothetical protein
LIFGDDDALLTEPERLVLEWSSLGIGERAAEVPQATAGEGLTPCYGVVHRTEDWPEAAERLPEAYRHPWLLGVFEGTKIGGLPRFIQDEATPAGRFFAALGSISTGSSRLPLMNETEPPARQTAIS